MIIALDGRKIEQKNGIGRVTSNIISHLLNHDRINNYILFLDKNCSNIKFKNKNLKIIYIYNSKYNNLKTIYELFFLHYILNKEKVDIFLSTDNFINIFFYKGKIYLTILDLIPLDYDYFKSTYNKIRYRLVLKLILMNNIYKIVTISHFSEEKIVKLLKIPKEKILVIPLGTNKVNYSLNDIKKFSIKINYKYILAIGGLEKRKNNITLIKAYINLVKKKELNNYHLIIISNKKDNILGEKILREYPHKLTENIIFTEEISNKNLSYLYENASIFVYISLYEGFGLPPLEAFSHNVPVISSNSTSIPEILANGAILINPKSQKELEISIKKIIEKKNLATTLIHNGKERLKLFDWNKTVELLIRNFNNI